MPPLQSQRKLLVLDPGHGGGDPGAVSGIHNEAAFRTRIINSLVDSIYQNHRQGIDVWTSFDLCKKNPNKTWPVAERLVALAAQNDAREINLLLSIHLNSAKDAPSAKGLVVCYRAEKNRMAAEYFYSTAIKYAEPMFDLAGNRAETLQLRPDLAILKAVPNSLLIEVGFISNTGDRELMLQFPYLYANAIKAGIYAVMDSS